ncbi:DapH/DapD/GlmU-related protein [Marinilactibacillus psychrotolerans]|uniref:acyltransferase n=1 Tax=Marinilactibacillus psychrotolerans TaxID=191770 RepID=UPI0038893C30
MRILLIFRLFFIRVLHPNRYSSEAYTKHLRNHGCLVGEGTYFFSPLDTQIDLSRPFLVEIGKYCKITRGVHILTHDYSRSVIRTKYKKILNSAKPTKIGDNVFIGIRAIILPGVTIGSNVIIGAGSVISKDVPDNVVVAGNPATVIMTIDKYYKNRNEKCLQEAVSYAQKIKEMTGRKPTIREMGDFFPLYFNGKIDALKEYGLNVRCNGDDKEDYHRSYLENTPQFDTFDDFLNYVERNET